MYMGQHVRERIMSSYIVAMYSTYRHYRNTQRKSVCTACNMNYISYHSVLRLREFYLLLCMCVFDPFHLRKAYRLNAPRGDICIAIRA